MNGCGVEVDVRKGTAMVGGRDVDGRCLRSHFHMERCSEELRVVGVLLMR